MTTRVSHASCRSPPMLMLSPCVRWKISLYTCLAIVAVPVPSVPVRYGQRIRRKSNSRLERHTLLAVTTLIVADGSRCRTTWRLSNDHVHRYRRSFRKSVASKRDQTATSFLQANLACQSIYSCPSLMLNHCPCRLDWSIRPTLA